MGIFDIFKRRKRTAVDRGVLQKPTQYLNVVQFNSELNDLLGKDSFLARSDYKKLIPKYKEEYNFFCSVIDGNILEDYVAKNNVELTQIQSFIRNYNEIKDLTVESPTIKAHNNKFVANHLASEKEYLDNILKACDPAILLDNEQRE
ncbi:MAG: hypothetical protein IIV68_05825, partial [Alistipes sp.]|nr:hypothetical protein [Alistipes sp.]